MRVITLGAIQSLVVLLAAEEALPPWVSPLVNAGVLGVWVVLMLMDKIGTHSERDRLRLEVKEMRQEMKLQNETFTKEITPPLIELARLIPQMLDIMVRRGER